LAPPPAAPFDLSFVMTTHMIQTRKKVFRESTNKMGTM
jgi:hypothetical protein